ncbi:MAG: hypothetical protein N2661_11235, partial [Anoxybacillus mongoliensis]|nr:hypothetical protein [Anoxybacillus mongoliensis]
VQGTLPLKHMEEDLAPSHKHFTHTTFCSRNPPLETYGRGFSALPQTFYSYHIFKTYSPDLLQSFFKMLFSLNNMIEAPSKFSITFVLALNFKNINIFPPQKLGHTKMHALIF